MGLALKAVKLKKCKVCLGEFTPRATTQKVCSTSCAIKLVEANKRDKLKKAANDDIKRVKQKLKQLDRESLKWQHKQAQKAFNRMRVLQEVVRFKLIGKEPECVSCGKTNMDFCCGHFKTVGAHGELRYDELNTHLQCNRYCNKGLSGNINGNKNTRGYIQGLIDWYGEVKANEIIIYCESKTSKKWSWQELEEMRKGFNVEVRKLESIL